MRPQRIRQPDARSAFLRPCRRYNGAIGLLAEPRAAALGRARAGTLQVADATFAGARLGTACSSAKFFSCDPEQKACAPMFLGDDNMLADLTAHFEAHQHTHLRTLFADDPGRFARLSFRLGPMLCDLSKHRVTSETMALLVELAKARDVEGARAKLFAGEAINSTEQRPALHTALRAPKGARILVDGKDVVPQVHAVRARMAAFCEQVRSGAWRGHSGKAIKTVINIGIGGSDLGPVMATAALGPYVQQNLTFHFVSNVDGSHLGEALRRSDPATTLCIIASKTFTTQETMANAHSARAWFVAAGVKEGDLARHFVALSTNLAATRAFGIDPELVFGFWEWVGGRYSMWSAIGLSIHLAIGTEHFDALLAGAHAMDEHFCHAPLAENLPVLLALIGFWYVHFFKASTHVVLPYEQYLHRFAAYLQQADMESNGKSVTKEGAQVTYPTGPILWGEPGTNGQHAFFQLLHQGTHLVPADFIVSKQTAWKNGDHHRLLLANCLAQSEALMRGRTAEEAIQEMLARGMAQQEAERLAPHRAFVGNRPSTTIVLDALTPYSLGLLVALYEHKIFVQGTLWGINSFDQWGVELGKQLAHTLVADLEGGHKRSQHDASTAGLLAHLLRESPG